MLFSSILPYFTDPLIWIGIILLLVFLLIRYFLQKDIITQLPHWLDADLPKKVLKHGFILGILVILLGVSLKYQERSEAEQSHALNMVNIEFTNNLAVTEQLAQNIQALIDSHQVVSSALRSGDSAIMNGLFSTPVQSSDEALNISKIVDASFAAFKESNLLKNDAAIKAFNASKDQLNSIIYPQQQKLLSMRDPDQKQYPIESEIWLIHKAVVTRIDGFDQEAFLSSLASMQAIRNQYDRVLRDSVDYYAETLNFLERNTFIGNGAVFEILTKEKNSLQSLTAMHEELKAKLKDLQRQQFL